MSKYQVTLSSTSKYNVTFPRTERRKIVDVDEAPVTLEANLANLDDVDATGRADQYFLIWNEATGKHEYVSAFEVADRSDGVDDDLIDYGTY